MGEEKARAKKQKESEEAEMRDRLTELVRDASAKWYREAVEGTTEKTSSAYIADHLLANGVIVPPCKVGDTVYVITEKRPCYACRYCTDFCHKYCTFVDKTELLVKKATVYSVCFNESNDIIHIEIEESKDLIGYCLTYDFNDFGKTIFLSKELAEKALERSGNESKVKNNL